MSCSALQKTAMKQHDDSQRYWQPRTQGECLQLMNDHPRATLLAGATAAQLGWPARRPWTRPPAAVIDLQWLMRDAARDTVTSAEGADSMVSLPALGSLELLRQSAVLRAELPALAALVAQLASAGVRRLATLGGNLAWPAGDLRVPLQVLDVAYQVADPRSREVGWHTVMPTGGLLLWVRIRGLRKIEWLIVEKVKFRAAFSPSLITIAMAVVDRELRIAAGGGVTPTQRLRQTEAAIAQGADTDEVISQVHAELDTAADVLASREERVAVAARCIAGHLHDRLDRSGVPNAGSPVGARAAGRDAGAF